MLPTVIPALSLFLHVHVRGHDCCVTFHTAAMWLCREVSVVSVKRCVHCETWRESITFASCHGLHGADIESKKKHSGITHIMLTLTIQMYPSVSAGPASCRRRSFISRMRALSPFGCVRKVTAAARHLLMLSSLTAHHGAIIPCSICRFFFSKQSSSRFFHTVNFLKNPTEEAGETREDTTDHRSPGSLCGI